MHSCQKPPEAPQKGEGYSLPNVILLSEIVHAGETHADHTSVMYTHVLHLVHQYL